MQLPNQRLFSFAKSKESMNIPITKNFITFIENILRFQCRLQKSTVEKIFSNNEENQKAFRQAFIHKSFSDETNYELYEFEGDPVVNLAVVSYIRTKFPEIKSVHWNTNIKHRIISSRGLAKIARDNGFENFLIVSDDLQETFNSYEDKLDSDDFQHALEDTVEALCGLITNICDKNFAKGVGYAACYNLIEGWLNARNISIKYEDVFDAKTRFKEFIESENIKWDQKGCGINECLKTYDRRNPKYNVFISKLPTSVRNSSAWNADVFASEEKQHISFGFGLIDNKKVLLSMRSANRSAKAEELAASDAIEAIKNMGIHIPILDPYKIKRSNKFKPRKRKPNDF